MRLKTLFVLLLLPVAGWLSAATPTAIAIRDAHIVTVSGEDFPKATLLLRNGLIEDVGPQAAIPPDAWIIEGAGLTVYPGFIDSLSGWGLAARPASASTTPPARAKGPEDRPQNFSYDRAADNLSPSVKDLDAARSAGFTSAATFLERGIFRGLGAFINLAATPGYTGPLARSMVVAEPIGEEVVLRVGFGGFSRSFPGSLMGQISYVRQMYLDLGQYQQAQTLYAAQPAGQLRPEYDHTLEGLAQAPRLLLPASESQQIDRMLRFGASLNRPFVLYGMHEAYREVGRIKAANIPVLVSLKWPEKNKEADPADVPNYRELQMRDQAPAVPALLAKAGVKFGFYSDGVAKAPDLKKALKRALDAGLTRADAIRALTLTPAEIYNVADRTGSIAKGKIANLTVMKGDAFDDKTSLQYVFIDGRQYWPEPEPPKKSESGKPESGKDAR